MFTNTVVNMLFVGLWQWQKHWKCEIQAGQSAPTLDPGSWWVWLHFK